MPYQSIFRAGLFDNHVILVTGGGSGIGRCIAHELAALGAMPFIAGRSLDKLARVADEIREDGGRVDLTTCDIREEDQVRAMIATILQRHGRLDGVVNNAGGQFPALLENISKKGFEAVVRNNLTGTFLVSREAVNQYMNQHGGSIVCMLADMEKGFPNMGHTGAARAAVANLCATAAVEWARYNIRINGILPGTIASSGLETYGPGIMDHLDSVRQQIPLKRLGTESEVSAAVVFLLSPASAYTTGALLKVDGASSLWAQMISIEDHKSNEPFDGFHRAFRPSWLPGASY